MSIATYLFPSAASVGIRVRMELAGVGEVALILEVSRQQVDRLARRADFPRPVAVLQAGRIWRRRDIERWALAHSDRRPGPPPKPYPPRRGGTA